MPIQALF